MPLLSQIEPPPEHGIHLWIISVARRLSFLNLSDMEIFDAIWKMTRGARRYVPPSEIVKSIIKVRGSDVLGLHNQCHFGVVKPHYEPETLKRLAARLPDAVDAEYLRLRSKFTLHNRTPAGFLHKLYRAGEKVVVFDVFESQGCEIWEHPGLAGNLSTLNHLQKGCQGVWFLANPCDGQFHWNPREEKFSRRSEESISCFRYAVLESDAAEPQIWLRALVQLPLPIAAVYSSGGSSVHALVRIDADSKAEWDRIVRCELAPVLVRLGADPAALSAVRLTRLPNCMRGENGTLQQLFYLDDAPDDTPICRKPRRDPDALRAAWENTL